MSRSENIVIRSARATDDDALAALAVIDGGSGRPEGRILVAEAGGRLRAALGENGAAISDPFWPSADLVGMLRVHASGVPVAHRTPRFALRRPAMA